MNYGREREREADMFASIFLARTNETDGLVGTFDKLRRAREMSPPDCGYERRNAGCRQRDGESSVVSSEPGRTVEPRAGNDYRDL